MKIIVHGATGAQGAPVLAALHAQGLSPIAAVRDPSAYTGVGTATAVDLSSVDSLATAYTGADAIFAHLPVGPEEVQQRHAEVIVEAVDRARPLRVVISTSGYPFGIPGEKSPIDTLVDGLRATGVSLAIVAPKLFLENLMLPMVSAAVESESVLRYPIREDYAISWISHLDMADIVTRLIQSSDATGVIEAGAFPGLLGTDLAAGFSAHLGKEVVFESQTTDAFGAELIPLFGEAGATPVVDSYRWRATQPDEVIDNENSAQSRLAMRPRSVAEWLKDMSV
ncbi:NAD(P)H-binding protein [Microbacterium sp. LMC-P-041]|uniref:NmrA family NAD(P)-binding protein n=1 Tax=Microbacterium sp. LMC-P-041 TaxID=3040293 RepID=UPI002556D612|nr:NAD(P)H-binding protein [Microbacterium sp. LMC-P-041]